VTSDHGEQFGEHGLFDHGNSLYRPPLQVPLILVWPGHVPAGSVLPVSVSLRDIPATVMDLIGAPNAGGFEGTSLARRWDGSPPPATLEPLFSELRLENGRQLAALTVGSMHYIRTPGQHDRLYDWTVDSAEAHSLITTPEGQARQPALRAALDSILSLHPVTTQR
jgi:arylsulfatase A-like enzyme